MIKTFLLGFLAALGYRHATRLALDEFKESDHPRGKGGKFVKKGSGTTSGVQVSAKKEKAAKTDLSHLVAMPRDKYPDHIKKLAIPPAWTDVKISKDPSADVLAIGKDAKGRQQRKYHPDFVAKRSKEKYDRVENFNKDIEKFKKSVSELRKKGDSKSVDVADCIDLIMETGLRPGSEKDTKAEKEARGASTLRGENVIIDNGKVSLKFTGKSGKDLLLPMPKSVAKMLIARKKKAGENGKLFSCSNRDVLAFMKEHGAKTKDLRTRLATNLAMEAVSKYEKPKTKKEYQRIRNEIADSVSAVLGNTRAMALNSYIAPKTWDTIKL